jgi:hypothetical protein
MVCLKQTKSAFILADGSVFLRASGFRPPANRPDKTLTKLYQQQFFQEIFDNLDK